jgi:hypothetical protein
MVIPSALATFGNEKCLTASFGQGACDRVDAATIGQNPIGDVHGANMFITGF